MSFIPDKIWLYRITHYLNISHILKHGLVTATSPNANLNFVSIGDRTMIQTRNDMMVIIPPFCNLSDYIPFYFGFHSPMLLQIITGNQGVIKRAQNEIVYIISSLDATERNGCQSQKKKAGRITYSQICADNLYRTYCYV